MFPGWVRPTNSKLLVMIGVIFGSIGSSFIAYRVLDSVVLAGTLFFPLRVYLWLRPRVRAPGYQDIMMGDCLIPYCDSVAAALTIGLSILLYYTAAVVLVTLYQHKSGR